MSARERRFHFLLARMRGNIRRPHVALGMTLAAFALIAGLDALFPPNLARYEDRSVEVRASDGRILRAFLSSDDKWRLGVSTPEVDPSYLTLLKAYEDRRFDLHAGVDPLAMLRAAAQALTSGRIVSGASTLTMQTARLLEPRPRGLMGKLIQAVRALQLERRHTKGEILSIYLTLAPFGGNLEGVRAASLAYFSKEPRVLAVAEAALLVALPQSPESLRPDRYPERARGGRDKVLRRMAGAGVLDQVQLEEALTAPMPAGRESLPFHVPQLAQRLAVDAGEDSHVRTPIDLDLQSALEDLAIAEASWFPDGASLAAVVVENKSRRVIATLGGLDFWGVYGQLDLTRAIRSPGSALKPFIYSLAFDELPLHPETVMVDEPLLFGDYAPQNFDQDFQGMVTVRQALQMSLNVPAVAVLDRVSPVRLAGLLERGGAHLAFPGRYDRPGLPMALGGVGITLFDLAQLYVALAEDGVAAPLVVDLDAPAGAERRLFSRRAAFYVEDILRGSPMPDGWARGRGVVRTRQIAFKTGTSYGYRDAWAVGYSPGYTVAIWVGRPDGSARAEQIGRNVAAPLVFKVFDLLPSEPLEQVPPPEEAFLVSASFDLPPAMQRFFANPQRGSETVRARTAAPQIAFPPNGATLALGTNEDDRLIELRATGGQAPLRWMVNGEVLPSTDYLAPTRWTAKGPGFVRFVVIDADGRAAASEVRIRFEG